MTAITYFGKEITYAQFFKHIDEAAKALTYAGVSAGDRIMYLMPNIPETAYLLYGGAKIGAVADYVDPRPDSIDPLVSAQKILAMFRDEKAKYLIALDQCYLAMLKPIESELKEMGVKQIVLVSASDSMGSVTKLNYLWENLNFNGYRALKSAMAKAKKVEDLVRKAKQECLLELIEYKELVVKSRLTDITPAKYNPDELAIIVHTSGTTSSMPKPIPLTHDNMNAYVHQSQQVDIPIGASSKLLHVLPYFAAYGVVVIAHSGFCHCANMIQVPEFIPSNLGKLINKYQPNLLFGTPSWYIPMLHDPVLQNSNLSCLKAVVYGGDSMEIEDEIKLNKFLESHHAQCIITKGHGMSETSGACSYATDEFNILGSIGIPFPHTIYAVVDPETKELMQFTDEQEYIEGELIISSPAVTPGILDDKEIVPHLVYNGESYILTRDIARMDRNGLMTFLSRSDRSFTRFDGYKIKAYEIEALIKAYPGVQYCILSPYYDTGKYGNVALADIVLENSTKLSRLEQVSFVQELVMQVFTNNLSTSTRQIPAWFRFRDSLPLTANSKVDYNALSKEALHGDEIEVAIEETNISVDKITVR